MEGPASLPPLPRPPECRDGEAYFYRVENPDEGWCGTAPQPMQSADAMGISDWIDVGFLGFCALFLLFLLTRKLRRELTGTVSSVELIEAVMDTVADAEPIRDDMAGEDDPIFYAVPECHINRLCELAGFPGGYEECLVATMVDDEVRTKEAA